MALIAVVAVIGLAIFLNWQLSNKPNADEVMSQQQSAAENSSHSSILGQAEFVYSNTEYFDAARLNRQESRQQAIDIANGILSSESATQEERDQAATQIMITPLGYRFRIVSRIITNFHQPSSTLLLLVAAYVGEDWHRIYDFALENGFRFLSYGDSSLLMKE